MASSVATEQDGSVPVHAFSKALRYADIGINLSDAVFRGIHHGKEAHPNDLNRVISRAQAAGVQKMMVTGSDLTESRNAIRLAEEYPGLCFATVGVHPCSAKTFEQYPDGPDALLSELKKLAQDSKQAGTATAFGEIGLDYDRLHYCDKETQIVYFERQLDLAIELQMPLFLHSRAAAEDFERLLRTRLDMLPKKGLVHSFTGSLEEMKSLVALGFDIGINGCSLKTEENLAVVAEIPLERLQIETDGPWCEMRPSHASAKFFKEADAPELPKAVKKEKWCAEAMVKGRNEPCTITRVAWVVARVKGVTVGEVCEQAWHNSIRMFNLGEKMLYDHLTALKPNLESGFVVMGGASLDEPITEGQGPKANGSILLAVADSKEEVVERLGKDPYVTAGVWDLDRCHLKDGSLKYSYQVRCKSQLHEDTSIVEKHHHIRIMSAQNICSPDDFNRAHCTNEHYCSSMGRH
nr:deoxyribonuclease Tat-D-like [Quercus suber]